MPTLNPRVNVTLSPSLDLLLSRMAKHTRTSKAQVLRELLEAAEPGLQRTVALMDAATHAAGAVKAGIVKSLDDAQAGAEKVMASQLAALDSIRLDLVAQAEAIEGRRPRRPGGPPLAGRSRTAGGEAPNPPASNRGVKSVGKGTRRGVKSPVGGDS